MSWQFDPDWCYFVRDDDGDDEQEVVTLYGWGRAEDWWREGMGLDMATAKYAYEHPVVGAYTGPPPREPVLTQYELKLALAQGGIARCEALVDALGDAPVSYVGAEEAAYVATYAPCSGEPVAIFDMYRWPDDDYQVLVCAEHFYALREHEDWDEEERILSAEEEAALDAGAVDEAMLTWEARTGV